MQFTASYSDVWPNELCQTDTNANGFYFGILAFLHVGPFRLKRLNVVSLVCCPQERDSDWRLYWGPHRQHRQADRGDRRGGGHAGRRAQSLPQYCRDPGGVICMVPSLLKFQLFTIPTQACAAHSPELDEKLAKLHLLLQSKNMS